MYVIFLFIISKIDILQIFMERYQASQKSNQELQEKHQQNNIFFIPNPFTLQAQEIQLVQPNDFQNQNQEIYRLNVFEESLNQQNTLNIERQIEKKIILRERDQTNNKYSNKREQMIGIIEKEKKMRKNVEEIQKKDKLQNQWNKMKQNNKKQNIFENRCEVQLANSIKGICLKQIKQVQLLYVKQKKTLSVPSIKQFIFSPLPLAYKINMILKKQPTGFLNMTKKYSIFIQENNKFLFSILKSGISNFTMSLSRDNNVTNNKNYLGRMVSNLSGSQFVVYDNGFSPDQTRSLQFCRKEVLSIKYQDKKGPRQFQVYLAKNGYGFYSLQPNENLLQNKYKKGDHHHAIKLTTKQPEYDPIDDNFKLDFKGIVGKASVKNFILLNQDKKQCLIFGRKNDDTFVMEVKYPLSVFQAVSICVSSINYSSMIL